MTSPVHLRRLRRRLAAAALVAIGLFVTVGVIGGALVNERRYHRRPGDRMGPAGSWGVVFVVALLLAAGAVVAGVLLWRRISRPLADLLSAADRIGVEPSAVADLQARAATAPQSSDVSIEPVAAPAGTPREVRALVDAFNAMASRIDRAERERRRFLADVSHELRTPLTVLRSGIEAQLDGVHERDDRRLAALLDETVILARLIDDLHALALHEAGRLTLHRVPTDIVALVRDSVDVFASAAEVRRVTVVTDTDTAAPIVAEVDGGRVRQVLANVLANAVRHAAEGGRVEVQIATTPTAATPTAATPTAAAPTAATPTAVQVSVRDDGTGIAPGELNEVFTRYRKAADSGGSGLGLTIARDLVEAHGGWIAARNNAGQPGATITFELPMRAPTTWLAPGSPG